MQSTIKTTTTSTSESWTKTIQGERLSITQAYAVRNNSVFNIVLVLENEHDREIDIEMIYINNRTVYMAPGIIYIYPEVYSLKFPPGTRIRIIIALDPNYYHSGEPINISIKQSNGVVLYTEIVLP